MVTGQRRGIELREMIPLGRGAGPPPRHVRCIPGERRRVGAHLVSGPLAAALLVALALPARAQTLREDFWVPNGTVEDLTIVGDAVYLGGSFTQVGKATGAFVGLDAATGNALEPWPQVGGFFEVVNAMVSDGANGWYVGGVFTLVRGQARKNLAHFDAAGNLTAWNPGTNGAVYALGRDAVTGVVYAGGSFGVVGGQNRNALAAIDANGIVTAFDVGFAAPSTVRALALDGSTLYTVGAFNTVAGQTRNRAASFDATTGGLSTWAPDFDETIYCMGLHQTATATHVYVGGEFTHVSGFGRTRLAMVDGTTGGLGSWNPGASGVVLAMALAGGTSIFNPLRVYVGGNFQLIATSPRSRVALINETGVVEAWNPGADDFVRVVRTAGDVVYVGGDFDNIGGRPFRNLAAIDASGAATSWDPLVGGRVRALGTTASAVFAGGDFWTANGVRRDRLAALSRTTGIATSWDPGANGLVRGIAVAGNTIYVGGDFTNVGGQPRNRLAALDASTGAVTGWNPDAGSGVEDVAIESGIVYAGGSFTTMGGQPRSYLAAIDAVTGMPTGWSPSPTGQVHMVAARGGTVYAGGLFTSIGGQSRSGFAALDAGTGLATAWNPFAMPGGSSQVIEEVAFTGRYVAVAGTFQSMGGRMRSGLAFLDSSTALANPWDQYVSEGLSGMAIDGSTIYVGGGFGFIGGEPRNGLAAIDAHTGSLLPYNPSFFAGAGPLLARDGTVYAGGFFQSAHTTFAVFSIPTTGVAVADAEGGPATLRVTPNPFRSQVALRFSMPRDGEVDVTVHDLAGRLVRRIERGNCAAGEQRVVWDGRDQDGRAMGAGIYLVRARAGSLRLTSKVARVE